MLQRLLLAAAIGAPLLAAPPADGRLPDHFAEAMQQIRPQSLKGHISFLASDALEGRDTPSRGLDIAAEYIASQFRRAGLDPVPGGASYFQTANWKYNQVNLDGMVCFVETPGGRVRIESSQLSTRLLEERRLENTTVFRVTIESTAKLKEMPEGALEGKAAWVDAVAQPGDRDRMRQMRELVAALRRLRPALTFGVSTTSQGRGSVGELIDPERASSGFGRQSLTNLTLHSAELLTALQDAPEGDTPARLTLKLPAAKERPVALHNVIGVLPGADSALKDSYVLVSAHYDHVGIGAPTNGDSIYNGANDDASGTGALMEIASVFAAMKQRPRRTIVFLAVFGEEKGLLGAHYYSRHPVFPLSKTVANVNLEHLGRTDASNGPQINRISVTGYGYSDVPPILKLAGEQTGVEIVNDGANGDSFFGRSDNAAFAAAGVPAHTLCVAFEFPDYHAAGDHWEKIDYDNLARVSRAIAGGVWLLGDRDAAPEWNASNEKTERYRNARGNKEAASPRLNE